MASLTSHASRLAPTADEHPLASENWKRVCARLRAELGDAKFDSWFARIELDSVENGAAALSVPTKFLKSWIQLHYLDRIRAIFAAEMTDIREIEIRVRSSSRAPSRPGRASENDAQLSAPTQRNEPATGHLSV